MFETYAAIEYLIYEMYLGLKELRAQIGTLGSCVSIHNVFLSYHIINYIRDLTIILRPCFMNVFQFGCNS